MKNQITHIELSRTKTNKHNFYNLWVHRGNGALQLYTAYPHQGRRIQRMQRILSAWLWI